MALLLFLLWFLYVGLTCLYAATPPRPAAIPPWPLLTVSVDAPLGPCQADSDCPLDHACLKTTCVRKLVSDGTCHPDTGQWLPYTYQHVPLAICSCYNHAFYTQKFFGGDCDVSVACGVHGQYLPWTHSCHCEPGYEAVDLTCRKRPVMAARSTPCAPDELDVSTLDAAQEGFHADYVARLGTTRCVKRPCAFDSLSGRPLKHGRFEPGWGCVCDPSYGLLGVELQVPRKRYLTTEGYDACASIFEQEPLAPIPVELVTYFYLGKREPVSLILFRDLEDARLVPLLRGRQGAFALHQTLWRYDYAQHYFQSQQPFRARTRTSVLVRPWLFFRIHEHAYVENFKPIPCRDVHDKQQGYGADHSFAYEKLYQDPVCTIPEHPSVEALFHDRVVLNPEQVHFQTYLALHRFNAFVMRNDVRLGGSDWTLDLDYAYNIDAYRHMATNAPFSPP